MWINFLKRCAFLLALWGCTVAVQGQVIRILFTSNSNGKIENCLCPDLPYGALEKRVQYILDYKAKYPDVLILDNGDNFLNYGMKQKESVILAAFQLIPYDVINLGDQDLAFAPPEYFRIKPVVRSQGKSITIRKKEATFSILPVLNEKTCKFYPPGTFKKNQFSDPTDDIRTWLRETSDEPVLKILLSHSGYEADRGYAQEFSGIDLIIGGHSQTIIDTLNIVNGTPVQQAGGNAEYVGEVRFRKQGSRYKPVGYKLHPMTLKMPTNERMQVLLNRYHQSISNGTR